LFFPPFQEEKSNKTKGNPKEEEEEEEDQKDSFMCGCTNDVHHNPLGFFFLSLYVWMYVFLGSFSLSLFFVSSSQRELIKKIK
jgi:hypothetical protein